MKMKVKIITPSNAAQLLQPSINIFFQHSLGKFEEFIAPAIGT
jgi:hypothetical protein